MRAISCLALGLTTAMVTAVALLPTSADAVVEKRVHAAICEVLAGSVTTGSTGLKIGSNGTQLSCPWTDAPDLVRTDIVAVHVYGSDADITLGAGWATAKLCRAQIASETVNCGTQDSPGASNFDLQPGMSGWGFTTGFAYILLTNLNANDAVRGILVSDT